MANVKTGRVKTGVPQQDLVQKLVKAMRHDLQVIFDYDGKLRVVEVHAIGTSTKDGALLFRGYQTSGDSSRPLPAWVLFRGDKVTKGQIALSFEDSLAPREGYVQGDAQMGDLIAEIAL